MFAYFNLSASFLQGIDTFLKQVKFYGGVDEREDGLLFFFL